MSMTKREFAPATEPTLRIDLSRIKSNADHFVEALHHALSGRRSQVFFAAKAHSSQIVLDLVAGRNLGCEAIRSEELAWATHMRAPVIVSGFVKSDAILHEGLTKAKYIVVESINEIERLQKMTEYTGLCPRVLLRVKANPHLKLGCSQEEIQRIGSSTRNLDVCGVHFHGGWNIKDDQIILTAVEQMLRARDTLSKCGRAPRVLNFGGGFGERSSFPDQLEKRVSGIAAAIGNGDEELHFEPGRYIVGDAGSLSCTIQWVDERNRILGINTCAYGFRLTGATPMAAVSGASDERPSVPWTLYGFWSSEEDRAVDVPILGEPRPGADLILRNMGAYTKGLEAQFAIEQPLNVVYV